MPPNLAPPETSFELEATSALQVTASPLITAPPPTNQSAALMTPSTYAPLEALHQVLPRTIKRARKRPKCFGFKNDDSSGESINSCLPKLTQPSRECRAGDVESVLPSVVKTIVDTAAQVEPTPNPYSSPVVEESSRTDPRIRANQSTSEELIIDEELM